ncbi:cytochrome P450 9e2 [Ooceraea biroi]|nr:cytochrome P450 9e2 [Ooceraea biroi]
MAVVLVSLILAAVVVFYFYLTRNYNYWQKCGVPCADGFFPGVGHMWMLFTQTMTDLCCKIYNDNKQHSMVGIYNYTLPSLMILEPELVKTVLQSNFASFHENSVKIDPKIDPLTALNPFFSYGEKWAAGRKRLTYAFSSMRLKILLESVKPVCVKLENYLDNKLDKSVEVEEELKNLFSKFTAQVVAGAGFGVDGYCFDDEKKDMSFQKIGKAVLKPSIRKKIVFTIAFFIPSLNKLFKFPLLPKQIDQFFRTLVTELIEQRRADGIPKNDFLQLMVELERIENDKFDVEMLASHALSFFLDGYETSSITLSFVGFQLATHPEVQNRLRDEVLTVLNKYDNEITYEALKEMVYMDQVINESMRLIPTGGFMSKTCTEEFVLKGSDGLTCRVQPGTNVLIPIQGLHKDSRYWENPDVFDPDRFSSDRKHNIQKYTFLPFGEGPRMCVGMRMALLQMKACLAALLRKYSLELSPKTHVPLKMIMYGIILPAVKGGLWVKLRKI